MTAMKRILTLLVLLAAPSGCVAPRGVAGPALPASDGTFARAARVTEPMLTCTEAMHAAVDAVRRMGYTVTQVERATAEQAGMVIGVRDLGFAAGNPVSGGQSTVKVRVSCSDAGSSFEAVSDEGGLGQLSFGSRFSSVVRKEVASKKTQRSRPPEEARGLVLTVQPQRSAESMAAFGVDLPAAGVTPVKVEIDNRSDRRYAFDASRVVLVTTQGKREKAMSAQAVAGKVGGAEVAARLVGAALVQAEVGPGAKASGYLFFPASSYRNARVILKDIDSDEPEGFSISF